MEETGLICRASGEETAISARFAARIVAERRVDLVAMFDSEFGAATVRDAAPLDATGLVDRSTAPRTGAGDREAHGLGLDSLVSAESESSPTSPSGTS